MKSGSRIKFLFVVALALLCTATWPTVADINIVGPREACEGSVVTLAAPAGWDQFLWSTGETTATINVSNPGRYWLRVSNRGLLSDSGEAVVSFWPLPRPRIGNPGEYICEGTTATLSASAGYRSYRWNTGATTREIQVETTGWYHLRVVDTNGCTGSSDSIFVTIVPLPRVEVTGPAAICSRGLREYNVDTDPSATVRWTVNGLGTIVGASNQRTVTVNWTGSGRLDVAVLSSRPDGGTCESIRSVSVRLGSSLRPQLDFGRRNLCVGDRTVVRPVGTYSRYRWNTGSTADSLVVTEYGLYWVEVEDSTGCTGISDSVLIRFDALPVITVSGAEWLCNTDTTMLTATAGGNDVVFWEWATGERTPSIIVRQPGFYTVTGTTINGCRSTVVREVRTGRRPPIADYTLIHMLGTIDLGSVVDVALDTVIPPTSILNVRLVALSVPAGTSGRVVLNDGSQLPGTELRFRLTTLAEGRHRAVVRLIVTDECTDSVDIEILFDVVRLVTETAASIALMDTTIEVGSSLQLPGNLTFGGLPASDLVTFDVILAWDKAVFRLDNVTGVELVDLGYVGSNQMALIRFANISLPNATLHPFSLNGTVLLSAVARTTVEIDTVLIRGNEDYRLTTKDGSIEALACWTAGRLVRHLQHVPFSVTLQEQTDRIDVVVTAAIGSTVDVQMFTSDGRAVKDATCTFQTNTNGEGSCTIRTRTLAAGLYLVRVVSIDGQRTLPVVIAP